MSGVSAATYIALASAAATAGGNYLQTKDNNKSIKAQYNARNRAVEEGLAEQAENQRQSGDVFSKALEKFQPTNQQTDLGAMITNRENSLNSAITPGASIDPVANVSNAPKVVQGDLASKLAEAISFGKQQGSAKARIAGINDQFLGNALDLNDSGLKLGTISDFAKGDARVNAYKQQVDFANAKKAPKPYGQLLSSVGSILSLPGVSKGITGLTSTQAAASPALNEYGPFGNNLPWRNTPTGA